MDQSHGPEGHGTRHPFVCAPTPGKVAVKAAILVLKRVFYLMESPSLRVFTPAEKPPKITVQSQQIVVALLAGFSFSSLPSGWARRKWTPEKHKAVPT